MKRLMVGACVGVLGLCGLSASGATLSGAVTTTVSSPVNLTNEGPVDWAIWDAQAAGSGTSGARSNRKLGGTAIGNMSAVVGTPRGITGTFTPPTYTYTNGTSPTSAAGASIGAITDTSVNVVGSGWRLSVTGDPLTTETVKFYVAGFNGTGTFTATLNGVTAYTDSSRVYGGTRSGALYTLDFKPDSASDLLQVSYVLQTATGNGNANVDLQAVAVSVPEPGMISAVGLGAVGLKRRRRR
jgi:hypothetical protein